MYYIVLNLLGKIAQINLFATFDVISSKLVIKKLEVKATLIFDYFEYSENVLHGVWVCYSHDLNEIILDSLHFEQEDEVLFFPGSSVLVVF